MQHVKKGDLVCIENGGHYYNFLVLSGSVFFGCQWAYCFHSITREISNLVELLPGNGFLALVDFIEERRNNSVIKVENKIDTTPYFKEAKFKARIDNRNGGHQWYIYGPNFNILKKQDKLLTRQKKYPVASGMKCRDAIRLIDKKWEVTQVVYEEGRGQFPF